MTRQEFEDEVCWWDDLKQVCEDVDCDYLDDVYSAEGMDGEICDAVRYELDHSEWHEIREMLDGIEYYDGDDCYYRKNGNFSWEYLNDTDFYEYKDEVEEWMSDHCLFDDDEEEVEEEDYIPYQPPVPEEPEEPEIEEPMEIEQLFMAAQGNLQVLEWKK